MRERGGVAAGGGGRAVSSTIGESERASGRTAGWFRAHETFRVTRSSASSFPAPPLPPARSLGSLAISREEPESFSRWCAVTQRFSAAITRDNTTGRVQRPRIRAASVPTPPLGSIGQTERFGRAALSSSFPWIVHSGIRNPVDWREQSHARWTLQTSFRRFLCRFSRMDRRCLSSGACVVLSLARETLGMRRFGCRQFRR